MHRKFMRVCQVDSTWKFGGILKQISRTVSTWKTGGKCQANSLDYVQGFSTWPLSQIFHRICFVYPPVSMWNPSVKTTWILHLFHQFCQLGYLYLNIEFLNDANVFVQTNFISQRKYSSNNNKSYNCPIITIYTYTRYIFIAHEDLVIHLKAVIDSHIRPNYQIQACYNQ